MRLDTAEKRAAYRKSMIRDGSTPDSRNSEAGECWLYDYTGQAAGQKFVVMAFRGKAGKPEFHYSYRTAEQREHKIAEFFAGIAAHQEYKAKQNAIANGPHDVKPGDIFVCSWGYDQTNIDYYQCVALVGSTMMEVREIGCQSEGTAWLQGKSVPLPNSWLTESYGGEEGEKYKAEHGRYPRREKASLRVKISLCNGEPSFRVASYASAYRMKPETVIAGKPIFREHHWTAYA